MTTRAFDIDAGFNSSTVPDPEDAVDAGDTPTFGQVALKKHWYDHVNDITAVKAIAVAARFDGQVVAIDGQILYQFDSDSAAAADDDLILQPDTGSGRWHKVTSGGSASVSGLSVEMIEQQCEIKHAGIHPPPFDISTCQAFEAPGPTIEGFLLDAYTAASTSMVLAVNPVFLRSANKNTDFNAGEFAAVTGTDAANIDTETTTKKIGSSAVSWDKAAGTSVNSFIQDDVTAAAAISLAGNRLCMFYLNMPTTTNLSTISIRLSNQADNPTDYQQFDASTQFDGTGFVTGWNLIGIDLDGTSTTVGTGWDADTHLLRTFAVGTVWSSAAQTATNIILDSLVFIADAGETVIPTYKRLLQPGMAYTIQDTSNQEQLIISSASTRVVGNITLAAGLTNSYGGGTASVVMRSVLGIAGDNRSRFQSTSPYLGATLSSGASNLSQDVRVSRILNESLTNATIKTTVAFDTPLFFEVIDTPLSTTVTVIDTADQTAQLLNTHTMHIVRVFEDNGKRSYQYHGSDITLTANSSHSSGVTTITASAGNITAIDSAISTAGSAMLVKAGQLSNFLSVVGASDNESFTALTPIDEFNIVDIGLPYPGERFITGEWFLGDLTSADAIRNRKKSTGVLPNLSINGVLNTTVPFLNGQFGAGPFSTTNRFQIVAADAQADLDPDTTRANQISISGWIYFDATPGASQVFMSKYNNGAGTGWYMSTTTSRGLNVTIDGTGATNGNNFPLNTWAHFAMTYNDTTGVLSTWVQGTRADFTGRSISVTGSDFQIGCLSADTGFTSGKLAHVVTWKGYALSNSDVNSIRNGGAHRKLGANAGFTYRYESTAQSGQKLSVRSVLSRTTSAVEPFVTRVAAIKTN